MAETHTNTAQVATSGGMRLRKRRWLPGVILSYLVVVGTVAMLTRTAHQMLVEQVQDRVRGLAGAVAFQVSDLDIGPIRTEADTGHPMFAAVLDAYLKVKATNPDVRYIYSIRPAPDLGEGRWRFVVDANPWDEDLDGDGVISKSEEGVRPGLEYEIEDPVLVDLIRRGMREPVAGREFTSDEWGTYISGYAPILDRTSGSVIAVQGVDITREAIRGKQMLVTVAAGIALVVLLSLLTVTLASLYGKAAALETVHRLDGKLEDKNRELVKTVETLRDREQVMNEDLAMAREVQEQLLPRQFPSATPVHFACLYQPSALIGGDLYDVFAVEGETVGFYMTDVCGHGVSAALITAKLKVTIDRFLEQHLGENASCAQGAVSPCEACLTALLGELNEVLCESLAPGRFITFQIGVLEPGSGRLVLGNAGHTPPVLWQRESGDAGLVDIPANIALGLSRDFAFQLAFATVRSGDKLMLYTDGLTERRNPIQDQYGEERLLRTIGQHGAEAPEELIARVIDANNRFAGNTVSDDDLAAMVIENRATPVANPGGHS